MTSRALASVQLAAVRPDRPEQRAIAERVFAGPLICRTDLGARRARSGRDDREFWQGDGWFLKSRLLRRYEDLGRATAALASLFAVKRALGELSPTQSILVVAAHPPGGYQLWTLAPLLVTLRERLDATSAAASWDAFAIALAGYGLALGESLSSSIDAGICLDPSPANFAIQGGRVRYLDDDVAVNRQALGIEDAFVARFAEYAGAPRSAWEAYVWQFVRELALRLSPGDYRRRRLAGRLRAAGMLRGAGRPNVDRVLAALEAL